MGNVVYNTVECVCEREILVYLLNLAAVSAIASWHFYYCYQTVRPQSQNAFGFSQFAIRI